MITLISANGKEKRIIHDDGKIHKLFPDGRVDIPDKRLVSQTERESYIEFMTQNLLFRVLEQ